MKPNPTKSEPSQRSDPSRLLLKAAQHFSKRYPVLDLGCGAGRNALALASGGFDVVAVDRDRQRLDQLKHQCSKLPGTIVPVRAELSVNCWPFGNRCFSAILSVHYLDLTLLELAASSLVHDGHLYIETVGGQGQNHIELPSAGALRRLLSPHFRFEFYKERPVGPSGSRKRAVKLLAQKTKAF
jgi:SAM-dependent methyltransferase